MLQPSYHVRVLVTFTSAPRDSVYGVDFAFFTVYGPRQRPDLAIHKFARKILAGNPFPFSVTVQHVGIILVCILWMVSLQQ